MIWEIDDKKPTIEGVDESGRPDPAYAEALGLIRAPFGRRALAFLCDSVIWLLLQLPLWIGAVPLLLKLATGSISTYGFVNHPAFVLAVVTAAATFVLTLVLSVVQLVLHATKGMTIGKAITGIRTVNVKTLERPRFGPVLLRLLLVAVSGLLPVLGPAAFLLSPTFDPERRGRGWHDKAAGVWLVDVRAGLQPYDEKRMRVARKMVKAEPLPERSALPSLATPLDSSHQPQYRPGSRISAGVIGVARPYDGRERPDLARPSVPAPTAAPVPVEAGKPVFGGYRVGEEGPASAPATGTDAVAPAASAAPAAPADVAPAAPAAPAAQAPSAAPADVAPAAEPAPAAVQADAPVAAHPEPAAAPAAAVPQPADRFALRLDTGETILVTVPVLLGRNPDAAEHPGAHPVPLTDETRSLSKTHLLVRPVDGGLEITDCHSTNGSGLIRAGVEYGVAADTAVIVIEGDMIRLGDRVAAVVRA